MRERGTIRASVLRSVFSRSIHWQGVLALAASISYLQITPPLFAAGTGQDTPLDLPSTPRINNELVVVIDQGVDFLASDALREKRASNSAEIAGRSGTDDDNNGFIDDLSGWNILSNSPDFFPDWIKQLFELRRGEIAGLVQTLDLRIPMNARQKEVLAEISELAHGTHVAGIIAAYSSSKTRLLSVNMQSASFTNYAKMDDDVSSIMSAEDKPSIFDDKTHTVELLREITRRSFRQADVLNRYLLAMKPAVANLSFGSVSKDEIALQAEMIWAKHLKAHSLKASTPRNVAQQKNFEFFVNNLYRYEGERWGRLFKSNSNTLFVIAAGNRSKDLETEAALPANLSTSHPNVITVMAASADGKVARFSNYGSQSVNVAAWGTDIPSAIPGGLRLPMSGTSMAAPFVSALASKLRVANPNLTARDTRSIIEQSVYRLPSLDRYCTSGGIIHFDKALEYGQRYNPNATAQNSRVCLNYGKCVRY